jgi:hypothetical protein
MELHERYIIEEQVERGKNRSIFMSKSNNPTAPFPLDSARSKEVTPSKYNKISHMDCYASGCCTIQLRDAAVAVSGSSQSKGLGPSSDWLSLQFLVHPLTLLSCFVVTQ